MGEKRLHEELFANYDCSRCRNCCKMYCGSIPEEDRPVTRMKYFVLYLFIRQKMSGIFDVLCCSANCADTIKHQKKEYPILSISQISLLLLKCKETRTEMYIPLLLTLTTGLRISEVIAIKFSDIDWWEGELHIRRQLGRTTSNDGEEEERLCTQEVRTKSHSGERNIPLGDFVIDELIVMRHKYETMQKSNPQFQNLDFACFRENGLPYNRGSFRKSFKELLTDCNFPNMRWHDLRHPYVKPTTKKL